MRIPLSGYRGTGKFVIIDDEDYDLVKNKKWYIDMNGYAIDNIDRVRMHRIIMDPPKNMVIDHINRNTLENRKENLRICTIAQNNKNRSKTKKHWPLSCERYRKMTIDDEHVVTLPMYIYPYYKNGRFCSYMFYIRRKGVTHKKKGFKTPIDAVEYRNYYCDKMNIDIIKKGEN